MFRDSPDIFRDSPDTFRDSPDTFRDSPDTFRDTLDKFQDFPDNFQDTVINQKFDLKSVNNSKLIEYFLTTRARKSSILFLAFITTIPNLFSKALKT